MADALSDTDYRALAEFRYQLRRYQRFSEAAAREAGLEPQQHQLLLLLRGLPEDAPSTIRVIAERLLIQHQSAVGLVDRSVERGVVRRRRGAVDRRTVVVELTPQGEQLLAGLSADHRVELATAAPTLMQALYVVLGSTPPSPGSSVPVSASEGRRR